MAYSCILSQLAAIEAVLDIADKYMEEDPSRYFASEIINSHDAAIAEGMKTVRKTYNESYIILSDAFAKLYEGLMRRLNEEQDPNGCRLDEHEAFSAAIRAVRPKLLKQAKSEMPVRRTPWRFI